MVNENEVITLVLSVGVLLFLLHNRSRLTSFRSPGLLVGSFAALLAGRSFTVLEDLWLPDVLNLLEHFCYAGSALLLALWCRRALAREGGRG